MWVWVVMAKEKQKENPPINMHAAPAATTLIGVTLCSLSLSLNSLSPLSSLSHKTFGQWDVVSVW